MRKAVSIFILFCFICTQTSQVYAAQKDAIYLPASPRLLALTQPTQPALLQGIRLDPKSPFKMSFLIDQGQTPLNGQAQKDQYMRLVKYFLTALTIPDEHMWVNLSPSDWVG